nr:hypothetical protein [Collimonas pratensis]
MPEPVVLLVPMAMPVLLADPTVPLVPVNDACAAGAYPATAAATAIATAAATVDLLRLPRAAVFSETATQVPSVSL